MTRYIKLSEEEKIAEFAQKAMAHFKKNSNARVFSERAQPQAGDFIAIFNDSFTQLIFRLDPDFEPRVYSE